MKQSFNSDNFIKIFYNENRKGVYLEGKYTVFKPIQEYTKSILKINQNFKDKQYNSEELKKEANREKNEYKEEKYRKLEGIFSDLENKIEAQGINFKLISGKSINNKQTYKIENTKDNPEIFFALKQVQKNIKASFRIRPSNRYEISNQVINMLDNDFPKYVIRTDIESFFESIPHNKLKEKLKENYILNMESENIINKILDQYSELSETDKGVPRGVGISSYLAELYMQDIDNEIKALPNLTYYARYVDDMILVFTPNTKYDKICYLKKILKIIKSEGLQLKKEKTKAYNLYENSCIQLDFLGYEIVKVDTIKINVSITDSKVSKYKEKIDSSIKYYTRSINYDEKSARKLLRNRLKYLTGNTRLLNAKKDILIGIYFSNILLTDTKKLKELDDYLKYKLDKLNPTINLQDKFSKYSFEKGFKEKTFYKFDVKTLKAILNIWR